MRASKNGGHFFERRFHDFLFALRSFLERRHFLMFFPLFFAITLLFS